MFGYKPALRVPLDDKDDNAKVKPIFAKENNNLCVSWIKPPREITLQSEAFFGETYEDLFVTRNAIKNSHFDSDLTGYTLQTGTPTISTDVYNTPGKSLKTFGTTSQYVINTSIPARNKVYYVAVKVRLDRYVAGEGIGYQFTRTDYVSTLGIRKITDGFITISRIHTTSSEYEYSHIAIGTIGGANADGYVDDVVIVDITDLMGYNPSVSIFDDLY
jgi:hypothetical protein